MKHTPYINSGNHHHMESWIKPGRLRRPLNCKIRKVPLHLKSDGPDDCTASIRWVALSQHPAVHQPLQRDVKNKVCEITFRLHGAATGSIAGAIPTSFLHGLSANHSLTAQKSPPLLCICQLLLNGLFLEVTSYQTSRSP
jgi:hypothetical protein